MKKQIISVLIILIALFIAVGYYLYYPNNKFVQVFDESKLNLVIGKEVINETPIILDDQVLLSFDTVKKYFDPTIYWDEQRERVTITTKDKVIRMKTDSLNAKVNNKDITLKIPVTRENNKLFIPIEFLSDFYSIIIKYSPNKDVIIIDYKSKSIQIAEPTLENAVVRQEPSIHAPILKKFNLKAEQPEEMQLRIFEEYDKWYKVRTVEGLIGYIQKKYVAVKQVITKETEQVQDNTNAIWQPAKGKVNMVWEMMYTSVPKLSKIKDMNGLDVVSPTWFQLANSKGELINRAQPSYVTWAHKKGYKVWALLSNDFTDTSMTSAFLNNTDSRDRLIINILANAALYKLDGINIDFENVNIEDKNALTQFIRELTPFLKEQGLIVSMDVAIPDGSDNYSRCYDREAIGEVVDYVMLMAYDQHWRTSPEAGSVAQITWVEENLKKTLKFIPKEKLLLGIPFYTRLWKEETDSTGDTKVSSAKTLSMEETKKVIEENKAIVKWESESGQFYAEYKKDHATYKIWVEDENSIELKSALVQKYKIAGTAAWSRTNESAEVWDVLNKNLKELNAYQAWLEQNKNKEYVYAP